MVSSELRPEDAAIRVNILPASRHHISCNIRVKWLRRLRQYCKITKRCEVPWLIVFCPVRKGIAKKKNILLCKLCKPMLVMRLCHILKWLLFTELDMPWSCDKYSDLRGSHHYKLFSRRARAEWEWTGRTLFHFTHLKLWDPSAGLYFCSTSPGPENRFSYPNNFRANHLAQGVLNTCGRGCTATLTWRLKARRRENCEGGAGLPDLLDLRVYGQEVSFAVNLLIDLSPDQGGQK